MALPTGLNDLGKLALFASDASYFTSGHPVLSGSALGALLDTTYGIAPQYSVPSGFVEVRQRVDPNTGFGFIAYRNQQTNEVIVAMRGTDGPNPQDWVANSQYLGWNQWDTANAGRDLVFTFLDSLAPPGEAFAGKIHFTGQSLGGALAQYAAYQYVQSHQDLTGFSKANITLTTFNALGGVLGLEQNAGGYNPTVLADIGSNAHFYTEGDLVSRLGSFGGVGHTGGTAYFINAASSVIDPDTGEPFLLNAVDAHRIETGFYPFLLPGVEFEAAVERPIEYLPMQNVQRLAALYGRIANDQDVSPLESMPRLVAGLIAGLSLGSPAETNALAQAVFTNLHSAGQMSDEWYVCLRKYDWGAIAQSDAFGVPAVAGYGVSLLGAMLSDALEFQVDRHVQLFNYLREWVSNGVSTVSQSVSPEDRRVQMDMMLSLIPGAAIGAKLAPVLQPLAIDIEEFAQQLVTGGGNWVEETFSFLREKANTAGGMVGSFIVKLGSAFVEAALDCGMTTTRVQSYLDNVIVPTILDTANGIANAISEFTQDIPNTLFNLGRTISSFADIQLVDQAYAAELSDPRLSPWVRAAAEDARDIVQRAGETVVIAKGVGINPFNTSGFDPAGAPPATVTLNEGQSQMLSIYLPFNAETGGQHLKLSLSGPNASAFVLRMTDGELTQQNGGFTVVVPEGERQLTVELRAKEDVSSSSALSLSAELTTASGEATHEEKVEASIALANTGELLDGSLPVINYANGQQTVTWIGDNDNNEPFFDAGANHVVFGNGGYDVLDLSRSAASFNHQMFGGIGNDELDGGEGKDRLYGEEGFDLLRGGGGDDVLYGGDSPDRLLGDTNNALLVNSIPGNDYLDGGLGDDILEGQGGNDTLYGGPGNDALVGDDNTVYMNRPVGNDYLDGGEGNDFLFGGLGDDMLLGGAGNDTLRGDNKPDGEGLVFSRVPGSMVSVSAGTATFFSVDGGSDYLDGGDGDDILVGEGGADVLLGGAGNDELSGDEDASDPDVNGGNDWLEGGAGNDVLIGGDGEDALFGGDDDDTLWGDYSDQPGAADYLDGGAGSDVLGGAQGDDILIGGTGQDTLQGDEGNDVLDGGEDSDTLYGGMGDDVLDGGAGDDIVHAGDGNDEVNGGDENDLMFGEAGDDFLDGEDGTDELQGGDGNDVLTGGAGNDLLFGEDGADTLLGETGDDELQGNLGNDLLFGDEGNDRLFGQEGDDSLFGGEGNDGLRGDEGNDVLNGDAGDDILVGDADSQIGGAGGDDVLKGGVGNDNLIGGGGRDTYLFDLGDGFDTIVEGTGEGNRLVFGAGINSGSVTLAATSDGSLVIRTGSGSDAIQILNFGTANLNGPHPIDSFEFSDGTIMTYSQLAATANGLGISGGLGNDLLVGTAQGERIYGGVGGDTLFGQDGADTLLGEDGADQLEGGADNDILLGGAGDDVVVGGAGDDRLLGGIGADVLQGEAGADTLDGGAGDDSLDGGEGNDVLTGGAGSDGLEGGAGIDTLTGNQGNDQLDGGDGSDVYRFSLGDGADTIVDSGPSTDIDTMVFGCGISSSDLSLKADAGLAFVKVGTGTDRLYVGSTSNVMESGTVENFEFADGTALTYADLVARGFEIEGTEFDDFLFGTNVVDRFRGGLGNDRMEGGAGNDSYFFNLGDGVDTIVDTASAGAGNEVVFGPGIASADLRLDLAADQSDLSLRDLLIRVGTNGEAVQIDTFDRNNVLGARGVESFRFADGSTLTYEQLLARGFDIVGTDGDDRMEGTNITDRISGGAGADVLRGGLGDDQLDGGAGDDRLFGGQGNDTYLFGPGSERDTIVEFQGSQDRIRMAPEVSPSDVMATRNNNDLVLSLNGSADRLTVSLYFLAPPLEIEEVEFVDGTVWDQAVIENLMRPAITGTGGNDTLVGTSGNDRLLGLGGDDELTGLAGNDVLDGGTGADTMIGGTGSDDYRLDDAGDVVTELPNEGTDTVESSISYTLGANVENLALTGAAAINGTGNSLDNVLIGNRAANVLTGGLGNDLYEVGAGDTVIELPGEGTDTVMSKVSASLGANLENLTILGGRSLTGTGNELDNVMSAPGSISILAGGFGNDTYLVGPGDDRDTIVEMPGEGIDTVRASQSYRLPDNVERLELVDPLLIPVPGADPLQGLLLSGMNVTDSYGNPLGPNGTGNALANTLMGTNRNNVLDGGAGADTLVGGAGDDRYVVDNVDDLVIEEANEGTDSVLSTAVSYQLPAYVEDLTLSGTAPISGTGNALDNTIVGNEAANVLDGGAGNDWLQGFGGADTYRFSRGSGQDTVFDFSVVGEVDTVQMASGVASADVSVYQRPGDLVLVINGTTDELTLSSFFGPTEYAQKQVLFADGTVWNEAELRTRAVAVGGTTAGTTGNDQLTGGVGHDVLIGDADDDVLTGGLGNDVLFGDAQTNNPYFPVVGNDSLFGGPGDDILRDFQGANVFDGGAGDDSLFLGEGQDTILFGRGAGSDLVYFDNAESDLDLIQLAADLSPSDVELTRDSQLSNSLTLRIRDTGDQMSLILSTSYPNVLPEDVQGRIQFADGTAWDLTWTPVGDPTIGTLGNDVLDAAFPSSLQGLGGNDEYRFGSPGIAGEFSAIEAVDGGTDTVQSYFDYTLDPNVENLILVESGSSVIPNPLSGTGNELNNIIIGNTGDNILDGRSGDDVLVSGLFLVEQDNHLVGDNGSDVLIGGQGDDTLIPFVPDVRGFGYLNLNGNSFSSRGYDLEFPNTPDDLLIGGQGNDIYILFNSGETVFELEDEGVDTVRSTVDYTLGANVENLTLLEKYATTPWAIQGVGNELDNLLVGNVSGNVLRGEGGDDTLWGGPSTSLMSFNPGEDPVNTGNDLLIGGAGDDTYLFNLGDGIDTIDDVAAAAEGNRIQFGAGISRNDLTFTQDEVARTLTIQVGSSGTDQLVLTNFDPTGANGSLVVETLAFADGSLVSLASLLGPSITIFGTENDDVLVGTAGAEGIDAGAGNDTIYANGGDDLVLAGEGDDVVTGEDGADTIFGGGGTDYLYGGDGNDIINGDDGNDGLAGQAGNDMLFGGLGNDVLGGGDGDDVLNGESGNDSFYGGAGNDLINGGEGDDSVSGEEGADSIFGGTGGDYLYGGDGDDILDGQDGNDVVVGEAGVDIVNGGAGNDVLNGGAGADQIYGGDGDDVLYIDGVDTVVNGGAGYDSVMVLTPDAVTLNATTAQVEFVAGNSGNDVLTAVGSAAGVTLYGGEGDDQLTGGDGNDGLAGQAGNDTLFGGVGNDVLGGGDGDDVLSGEAGNDTFYGGAGSDLITGGEGDDAVSGEEGNDTIFGGSGADYLYGGEGDDVIEGDDGNDTLVGEAGNDVLRGGLGNDVLNGGAGADQFYGGAGDDSIYMEATDTVVNGGAGYDSVTVLGLDAVTLNATTAEVEFVAGSSGNDIFTAVGSLTNVTLYGGEGDDQLTGGDGNDGLVGQAGNDTLFGGLGNDGLNGGEGDDVLDGGAGNDAFYAGTGNDLVNAGDGDDAINGEEGADTIFAGSGQDYLYGGDGGDILNGEEGNDVLSGDAGNDTLTGGLGNDHLAGGTGNDQYTFARGDGTDAISENDATVGNSDRLLFSTTINPLDLVISRQANDLRLAIHGTHDQVQIENWYLGEAHQVENVQAGNGQALANTQVDQLIQAMAAFSEQSGLTWDQAIDQRPQEVQAVLAASWQ